MAGIRTNPHYQAICGVLGEYGLEHSLSIGGKHPRVTFDLDGHQLTYSFAGSPSDTRGALNCAADLRKLIEDKRSRSVAVAFDPVEWVFDGRPIRVAMIAGDPWFVAADVCAAVGIGNSREALSKLDADEKGVSSADTPGGRQNVSIVSESGLYALILRCRDAMTPGSEAHRFRKWVTAEVLPGVRKSRGGGPTLAEVEAIVAARIEGLLDRIGLQSTDRVTAGQVCDMAGVRRPGRGLILRVSGSLRAYCADHGVLVTRRHIGAVSVFQFPLRAACEWVDGAGRALLDQERGHGG